jgi:hypothetical protein
MEFCLFSFFILHGRPQQALYRQQFVKFQYVLSNSKFYIYRVLFSPSWYILNIDFQQAISKLINLYPSTFLSSKITSVYI